MDTATNQPLPVSYADVAAAAKKLEGVAHRTPALTSRTVDERTGAKVYFKCENFQRMGAFKFRGAYYALSNLSDEQKRRGVVAYSSGNHAQAVALAGKLLGVKAVIVMPDDAPAVKLDATRGYGAEVIIYNRETQDREQIACGLAEKRSLTVIPPFDHPYVVAGQGTAATELIEDVGPLDYLLVPCGGGGLISGCAIAANHLSPGIKAIGVEPAAGDDVTRSFRTKTLQIVHNPDTIADGARTHSAGKITFPLILHHVHDMLTVTDEELLRSMFYLWERMKIVVEPTGALAAAALLEGKLDARGGRVGVIISGGNVDLKSLTRFI
ncbi:MAG: threo-3-hydroxy-L-aspartate ammonia-lyase [Betaproteobacteria bacterium]|nr:threo-3-hydroxy-L-aspartate ammonia-lyase [Betaproteobacteria bacterium]